MNEQAPNGLLLTLVLGLTLALAGVLLSGWLMLIGLAVFGVGALWALIGTFNFLVTGR